MRASRDQADLVKAFAREMGVTQRTAQRHRKQVTPEWVRFTERKASGQGPAPRPAPPGDEDVEEAEPVEEFSLFGGGEGDAAPMSSVEQARKACAQAYHAYQRALAAPRPQIDVIERAARLWKDSAELLRKWETSSLNLEKASGGVLPQTEVAQAQVQIHTTIASGVMGALLRVAEKLAPERPAEERRVVCDEARDALFRAITREALVTGDLEEVA